MRFFRRDCATASKVHITAGHSTVMATVHFFGAKELAKVKRAAAELGKKEGGQSKGAEKGKGKGRMVKPPVDFEWSQNFEYQEKLMSRKDGAVAGQWAYLSFENPIFLSPDSTLIGSRLDISDPSACRIAFHGVVHRCVGAEGHEVRGGRRGGGGGEGEGKK